MTGTVEYWNALRAMAKKLGEVHAVDDFRVAVLTLADMTARAMTNMNLTPQQVDQYRGQLSFCYKIAEDAQTALDGQQGEANARRPDGFQSAPR